MSGPAGSSINHVPVIAAAGTTAFIGTSLSPDPNKSVHATATLPILPNFMYFLHIKCPVLQVMIACDGGRESRKRRGLPYRRR